MAHRRHHAKGSRASILGVVGGFLLLACAVFALAFTAAGLFMLWLGLAIGVMSALFGVALIVKHIRSHQTNAQGQP